MSETKQMTRPAASYDGDLFAWTQDQARILRSVRPNSVDWANLAEEIETLGRSQQGEIESRLYVLLVHLLKWQMQPGHRKGGWRGTITEQRTRIARVVRQNPSLGAHPGEMLAEEYRTARLLAAGETGLGEESFPTTCPFTIEQVLDENFWPEGA